MLVFLDLQTTGLEVSDKICSIATIVLEEETYSISSELINENKKIPPLASSMHHITNEMIQSKVCFKESEAYEFLVKHNNKETTLVMHNAKFDLEMLSFHGLSWVGNVIDTLRVSKHLIPECELFALQVLRYELKLYKNENILAQELGVDGTIVAHESLSDALVIHLVYNYLAEMVTDEEMLELSYKNVLLQKFEFGKYVGRYIEDVATSDSGYLIWMLENMSDLDEDLRYSIVHNLGESQ